MAVPVGTGPPRLDADDTGDHDRLSISEMHAFLGGGQSARQIACTARRICAIMWKRVT